MATVAVVALWNSQTDFQHPSSALRSSRGRTLGQLDLVRLQAEVVRLGPREGRISAELSGQVGNTIAASLESGVRKDCRGDAQARELEPASELLALADLEGADCRYFEATQVEIQSLYLPAHTLAR